MLPTPLFADIDGPVYPMELPLDSLRTGPIHLNLQFDEPSRQRIFFKKS